MNRSILSSFVVLSSIAGLARAQEIKVPRPLPVMQDVKTAPAPTPYMPDPAPRVIPESARHAAPKPPKTPDAPAGPGGRANGQAAPGIDFSRVVYDQPGDGATWARGRTYKVRFDERGATYIPFLGSNAPHDFPVNVELASASVGGAPLALEQAGVTRDGDDITIERGALRETWHLTPDAAEQSFVLAARPAAAGALRLRLALDTELAPRESAAGIELGCEHGSVVIGRAIAIDAAGRRVELTSSLESGALAIDVPAELLGGAAYPLIVDPVYSTNALDTSANATSLPDIANSGQAGYWAAVYEFSYSQTDADVYTVDVYFGIPQTTGAWVDYTTSSWLAPRIAYNAFHDTYLTVASVRPTTNAPGEIWCRARQAGATAQYAQHQIQSSIAGSCFYSDVGGDPALAPPTYFMAVWTRNFSANDWDIHGRLIDWDGTPLGSSPIFIENSGSFDWFPRISKTDGRPPFGTQEWNIVWMRGNYPCDIYGAQIHWDGTITSPSFAIDTSSINDTFPAASSLLDGASGPRPWMVAFTRPIGDTDIWGEVLVGASVVSQLNVSVAEGAAIYENQGNADVDSNGQRFVLAYSESYSGSTTDHDLYVTTLHYAENVFAVDEAHQIVDFSSADTTTPQISGCMTETDQGFPYYGLAWDESFSGGPYHTFVGAYYEPQTIDEFCLGDGTAGTCPCGNYGVGGGCTNSAGLSANIFPTGNNMVSADTFSMYAWRMPTSTTCLFFQGTAGSTPGTVFGDGLRCVGGTIIRIGTKAVSSGNATYPEAGDPPVSVKGLVPAEGGERYYQVWYRNAASFCTSAAFNTTSGVHVLWLR